MMKVALVALNASYIHPNLALRYLYVARIKDCEVKLFEYTIKDDLERISQAIKAFDPDYIGLSTYIWNAPLIKKLVLMLEPYRIILGGPEVSYDFDEWLKLPIYGLIKGEGEVSFWQVIKGEKEVAGFYQKGHEPKISYAYTPLAYLESLESPYYLKMDELNKDKRYLYMETSRGCPFKCSYCLAGRDNRLRYFSLDHVKKELKKLEGISVKQVKLLDRTFNANPQRALELARFINELKVDFSFQFEVVLTTFDDTLLQFFMNEAKKERFRFEVGVQSYNPLTLEAIDRHQDCDMLDQKIKMMVKAGLILHTDLIAGLPYDTFASFKASFKRLFKLRSAEIQMGTLKLLKGTPLRTEYEKAGYLFESETPYEVVATPWLKKEELDQIKDVAYLLNRLYNSGLMRDSLDKLDELGFDVFELLLKGRAYLKRRKQVQIKDYFLSIYEQIKTLVFAKGLLLSDYYRHFKERPAPLFERKDYRYLYPVLIKQGLKEHELYEYSLIDVAYKNDELCLQLVLYNHKHELPTIYYLNEEGRIR